MDYASALEYLDSLKGEGIKPRLEHTKFILERLGFRQDFRVIHVAGSKGKGSVSAFANSILCEAGFKTGFYLSPPLQGFVERISVNRRFVSEREVVRLVEDVKPFVEELSFSSLGKPTFFEVVTAMALRYFQIKGVEFAVLEVGMGGCLDSTNVVDSAVSVVTNIELEHTRYLGSMIAQITREKAGIIKPNTTCVTESEDSEVLGILEGICAERNARLVKVGSDVRYGKIKSDSRGQSFGISGGFNYRSLRIKLLGEHQVANAVTAVTAVRAAINISEAKVRSGLIKTKWPGRLEVVSKKPTVLLDGAHTMRGVAALVASLELFEYDKLYIVLGISKDKPMTDITRKLAPLATEVIATKAAVENAGDPRVILGEAVKHTESAVIEDVGEAVRYVRRRARPRDLILITGSLYVVGEARRAWHRKVVL